MGFGLKGKLRRAWVGAWVVVVGWCMVGGGGLVHLCMMVMLLGGL